MNKQIFELDCLCNFCGNYSPELWLIKIGNNQTARTCSYCYPVAIAVSCKIQNDETSKKMFDMVKDYSNVLRQILCKTIPHSEIKLTKKDKEKLSAEIKEYEDKILHGEDPKVAIKHLLETKNEK